jgi:hypothetical protein
MSSNLDIVWNSSTPATLAAQIVADCVAQAERKEAARKRAAERQQEKLRGKKQSQ